MQDISPVTGWSLDYIAALDLHSPGAAGTFLRASAERRQVVAALLSTKPCPTDKSEAENLAEIVSRANHKVILEAAFGTVPPGMRGALARSGDQPHPRPFYRHLFQTLSASERTSIVVVIGQLESIDLMRLRVAQRLADDICTARLVALIGSVGMASDVDKLVNLMTSSGIDRVELAQALRRVGTAEELSELWWRWSLKLSFPLHPVPASECYIPVSNGVELRQLALKYRNCARRYVAQALEGQSAFAEFSASGKRCVVHLCREGDGWVLEGAFAKDNGMVAPELRSAAIRYLVDHEIGTRPKPRDPVGEWGVLRRLSHTHMFDF